MITVVKSTTVTMLVTLTLKYIIHVLCIKHVLSCFLFLVSGLYHNLLTVTMLMSASVILTLVLKYMHICVLCLKCLNVYTINFEEFISLTDTLQGMLRLCCILCVCVYVCVCLNSRCTFNELIVSFTTTKIVCPRKKKCFREKFITLLNKCAFLWFCGVVTVTLF